MYLLYDIIFWSSEYKKEKDMVSVLSRIAARENLNAIEVQPAYAYSSRLLDTSALYTHILRPFLGPSIIDV